MGIALGVIVLLVSGYLLAAALQRVAMIKPYVAAFALAGLLAVAALILGGALRDWTMLAAKLLALLGCLTLCMHLAVLVAKRMTERPPRP